MELLSTSGPAKREDKLSALKTWWGDRCGTRYRPSCSQGQRRDEDKEPPGPGSADSCSECIRLQGRVTAPASRGSALRTCDSAWDSHLPFSGGPQSRETQKRTAGHTDREPPGLEPTSRGLRRRALGPLPLGPLPTAACVPVGSAAKAWGFQAWLPLPGLLSPR